MANEEASLVTLAEALLTLALAEDDIVDDIDNEVWFEDDKEESSLEDKDEGLEETRLLVADVQLNNNIHVVSHTLVFIFQGTSGSYSQSQA